MENTQKGGQIAPPTIEDKEYADMMQALINYNGHYRMAQGWFDIIFTHRKRIAMYDQKIMHCLTFANGHTKFACKEMGKTFVHQDEKSFDVMYDQIGKGISGMALIPFDKRDAFLEELQALSDKYYI
jgi:hypothetical protein